MPLWYACNSQVFSHQSPNKHLILNMIENKKIYSTKKIIEISLLLIKKPFYSHKLLARFLQNLKK